MNLTTFPPALIRAWARLFLGLPSSLLLRLGGARARAVLDGRTLDAQIAVALAMNERFGPPPLEHGDPASAREITTRGFAPFDARTRPMAAVRELTIEAGEPGEPGEPGNPGEHAEHAARGRIRARLYRPQRARARGPAVLFYHGGGGVVGSVADYDAVCRVIADDTGYTVISVDYRLAPEHPFPAGVEDALAAYRWVRAHAAHLDVDPERLAVAGDSMGGSFAAVVCQQARDTGLPVPALQVLLYPGLDCTLSGATHQPLGHGYLLTGALIRWFRSHYVADEAHWWDVRATPLFAVHLAGLPRALVITAGFDPLRHDGQLYAERLQRAGVEVRYRCEPGLIHGYVTMTGVITEARRAAARMNADIRELLG
jgi:acetyl esterase